MSEQDVEIVLARALEIHPGVTPRIISDNGPQFIAKDRSLKRMASHGYSPTSNFGLNALNPRWEQQQTLHCCSR